MGGDMSRWREPPAELDPAAYRVAVRPHLLRDHSVLDTRQLATNPGYGTKSWERYLGGTPLPPHNAVEVMARLADEPPAHCPALWEIAESTESGRTTRTKTGPG